MALNLPNLSFLSIDAKSERQGKEALRRGRRAPYTMPRIKEEVGRVAKAGIVKSV
jgi:hypothetical protein